MHDLAQPFLTWVRQHQEWSAPLVFVLSFCESFAFLSLVVPATVVLVGISALIATTGLNFWPLWAAAVLGAIAGDWMAYDIAWRYKDGILQLWPFSTHELLVVRGHRIETSSNWYNGPERAEKATTEHGKHSPSLTQITAPWLKFQAADVASAFSWATAISTPGFLGIRWLVS